MMEAVGGALIDDMLPAAMASQALDLALARIERPYSEPAAAPARRAPDGSRLPTALLRRKIGARRWVMPGMWVAQVHSHAPDGWRTYLLRASGGASLLEHGHNGPEFTTVLQGAFSDATGRYGAGDFAEADAGFDHRPRAEPEGPCLCLITSQGGVKVDGLARLLQPLLHV